MREIAQLVNYYIMVCQYVSIQIKQIISVMNMSLETQLCFNEIVVHKGIELASLST